MKWATYSNKAELQIARPLARVVGAKEGYTLLVLAALVLLTGASEKWSS